MQLTPAQREAVDLRDGPALVSAGAGTGKTSVLVERFVQAVLEDGVAVDSVLAITFTEKAAAQLTTRVRGRFAELGARDEARQAESAWISTIHGFCSRVLRTHSLAAGIDPEFRVLDAVEAERVALDAFDRALAGFLAEGAEDERLRLIAAHTPDRLADMLRTAYSHLRSQGRREPSLPEPVKPPMGGERKALAASVGAALREIGAAEGKNVGIARGKLERCGAALGALTDADIGEPADYAKLSFAGSANALKGPACDEFRSAHEAWQELCVRHRAHADHVLLRDLMARYGLFYAEGKRRRSGLDFDDLELLTRDLLAGNEAIRASYAERFSHVMVDEFQDTNPLQNELLCLLERGNLFRVGDERQSIYRFRHADVGLFREHRASAAADGRERSITQSFRSRGEVLDAIDLVFEGLWGDEFRPLEPGPEAWSSEPRMSPCVELLVTDRHKGRWDDRFEAQGAEGVEPFGSAMRGVTPWRAAEARLLARRVEELTTRGPFSYGEVVLLLRATTHIGVYERALEERGIPTYVLGGRGYWSQQQVGDLRAYLAALANPLDELALLSVLASPFAGISVDTLVILASSARAAHRNLWSALGEIGAGGAGDDIPEADAKCIEAFVERFVGERAAAARISIETLIDRVVTGSGYDRAILAMPAGDRRMANVRKLMRMAREFEAEEGRDLRGFIDFVAERDLITEREGHAPLEAEDLDAVKLMTIHRAKGLEFPVVCVADLGKGGREDDAALRISDDGRLGIRLASPGGEASDSAELSQMKEQGKLDDEEEERRIFYVAATRAQEHLVLSGATDLEKLSAPAALEEPMRWLWPTLAPGLAEMGARGEAREPYGHREVVVRCEVLRPEAVDDLLPAHDREPARPEPEPPGLEALTAPALAAVPVPEALPVSRLSYSSLARYERCGYRFYLERALGLPATGEARPAPRPGEANGEGLPGLVRGTVVHALLERLDPSRARLPEPEEVAEAIRVTGEPVREADVEELISMVAGFTGSPFFERLANARRVRAELPFAFTLDTKGGSLLVDGVVDVQAEEGDRLLVVDYKSDRLEGREPSVVVAASYSTQRLVYALATLRSGAPRAEVVYVFLERPDEPVAATFGASELPQLETQLLGVAEGVLASRFEPSRAPHRGLCAGCPGQASLCVWGPERTQAEEPPPVGVVLGVNAG
ncbi:MAG: UvrD-helicase domain-containing protein [Thermoleophilaceae bacterium]